MGRRRHLGSLKSFLSNVSQLSWGQNPVFSDSELSRAHGGSGCSLMTVRSHVLLPECPEGLESLMAVTSLFIDTAGSIPILTIYMASQYLLKQKKR